MRDTGHEAPAIKIMSLNIFLTHLQHTWNLSRGPYSLSGRDKAKLRSSGLTSWCQALEFKGQSRAQRSLPPEGREKLRLAWQ